MKHLKGGYKYIFLGTVVIAVVFCVLAGCKFIQHEKDQNRRIYDLECKVANLQAENSVPSVTWNREDYNYLAIGNSITLHGKNDYWWNECGMASSRLENDYVHQLSSLLQNQKQEKVVACAYNFSMWEVQSADRAETLPILNSLMSKDLDLVTIQLSENATDLVTFESDFEELIRYVQTGAPNAQVLVIGDFWDKSEKDSMKKVACQNCGVTFVSLNEIKENDAYQCDLGTIVYDEEKNPHTVEHDGVAKHPGDAGMEWIAKRIMDIVGDKD